MAGVMLVAAIAFPGSAISQTIEYDVVVLGKVPGSYLTYVRGLNDRGDVVGMALFIPGGLKGFTWSQKSGFELLPDPPGMSDFGAIDINNAGVIAGDGGGDAGEAWRYQNGSYEMLGVLPGTAFARTVGISETGSVAGTCYGTLFYTPHHSFIAQPGLPMVSVLDDSYAGYINGLDQMTGTAPQGIAYRLSPGGQVELLPPLGERSSTAGYSINNLGNVVGMAQSTAEHSSVPFLYMDAAGMLEIGDLGGRAFAGDVNDWNEVVGEWEPSGGSRRPWVWSPRGGVRLVAEVIDPGAGLRPRHVYRINNEGQMIADGRDGNSDVVAFLLTPRCPTAHSRPYGDGLAGNLGVPELSTLGDPVIGGPLDVRLENSAGVATSGVLFVGLEAAAIPGGWGSDLLVVPAFAITVSIPVPG